MAQVFGEAEFPWTTGSSLSTSHTLPVVSPGALGNQLKPNSPLGIKHSAAKWKLSSFLQAITYIYKNASTESEIHGLDGTFYDTCLNSYPCA